MSTTNKPNDTRAQLRSLMSQHTAATYAKPAPVSSVQLPTASRPIPIPAVPRVPQSVASRIRYTVPLSPKDVERLNTISLEAHQRLGKRLSISEIFRIGLARISSHAPITADELHAMRFLDERRNQQGRGTKQ
jgi:hypothetical protein